MLGAQPTPETPEGLSRVLANGFHHDQPHPWQSYRLCPNTPMASGSRRVRNKPGHAATGGWIRPRYAPRKRVFGIFGSRGFTPGSSNQRSHGVTHRQNMGHVHRLRRCDVRRGSKGDLAHGHRASSNTCQHERVSEKTQSKALSYTQQGMEGCKTLQ